MTIKFAFISIKSPKWHIYHTNSEVDGFKSFITFKNSDTDKQFQYYIDNAYNYTSTKDYISFYNDVMEHLKTHSELLPFDDKLIGIIIDKVNKKYNEVINILNNENTIDIHKLEVESDLANKIVDANIQEFNIERQELKEKEHQERETLITEASRLTGRVEAFGFISKVATVSHLMTLKKIKDSNIYKELPQIKTWEEYCKSIGYTRRHIDDQLESLNLLGSEFLETGFQFGLGYRDLKELKKQVKSGNLEINESEVVIDGEVIPLDDKDELRDALDSLLKSKYKEIEKLKDEIKNKEVIIEDKEQDIKRLQASNNTFFKEKEKAENELNYLKAEGSINSVNLEDNPDFQSIKQCENDSTILIERLIRLSDRELSSFNKSMLGGVVIKIMNDLHNLHQELCSKGISDYFGDAFIDEDVISAENTLITPTEFLKQGNEND